MAKDKEKLFADLLAQALDSMAEEGWSLIAIYGPPGKERAIYRRENEHRVYSLRALTVVTDSDDADSE